MHSDPLDQQLADYARQPLPAAPDRLAADVWREIEQRRHQTLWGRMFSLLDWHEFFVEPRLVAMGMAFAVMIGILPGALAARAENQNRLAQQSMHFGIFTTKAAGSLGLALPQAASPPPAFRR